MPNGVTFYHGTYVLDQSVADTTLGNTITLNNSVGNSSSSNNGSGGSGGSGGGYSGY